MFLNQYIQKKYNISRRQFTQMINQGQFFLNKEMVNSYKQDIKENDELTFTHQGKKIKDQIKINQKSETSILLFNKPKGYVVSKSDKNNETIYKILPNDFQNYYYIGRLDKDSHGLLLLTDDPKLVNEYEHPKNKIEKTYIIQINKPFAPSDIKKCLIGILDQGENLKIKKLEIISKNKLQIILTEGKKRHIRRIMQSLGYHVLDLQRISEGKFSLGNLKIGEWKLIKLSQ